MSYSKSLITSFVSLFLTFNAFAQTAVEGTQANETAQLQSFNPNHARQQAIHDTFYTNCIKDILAKGNIGQQYVCKTKDKQARELEVTYLGSAVSTAKGPLRILNISYYETPGNSDSINQAVVIYDSMNRKLGSYYLGTDWVTTPPVTDNGISLIYTNESACNQASLIDLTEDIPQEIFIGCTKGSGDGDGTYQFSAN